MKFKVFLTELENDDSDITDALTVIKNELALYSPEELEDFGEWLQDSLDIDFDDDDDDDDEDDSELDYNDIIEIISELDDDDLNYVMYMMEPAENNGEYDPSGNPLSDIDEGVSRRFKAKNRNKSRTKRFTLSKAKFRAGKANRKKDNRKNKVKRKMYYRKNKIKIKKYDKSYSDAVKSGKHFKKIRR